ncbi:MULTISPECIES: hypothetical protein [Haloferacaceae]|uniref:Uncharacterized protein n=1 Tax=Halorubrum glutamatedens TaxID=2707018 RepID=A0ABD5QUT3_9EURY|nr:hypothetical protein [Halobellus captivus]
MTTRDADGDVARTPGDPADEGLLSRVGSGSVVLDRARAVGDRVASTVRASWLYRWLTAEPDPDVIVIDLRETWTVGPFLRILDWIVGALVGAMEGSILASAAGTTVKRVHETPLRVAGGLAVGAGSVAFLAAVAGDAVSRTLLAGALVLYVVGAAGLRDRRSWPELRDTRPVELLIRALEPPAPPEANDEPTGSDETDVSIEDDEMRDGTQSDLLADDGETSSTDPEPTLFPEDSDAVESNRESDDDRR